MKINYPTIIKTARNSSSPILRDLFTVEKNQSLRKRSNKRYGGQPKHKGATLQHSDLPTNIESYNPTSICQCGNTLNPDDAKLLCKRHIFDIPSTIEPLCIEHYLYENRCS
ncbi:hypothetical protein K4L44_02715 [Halosquirtibacter laminarini]|uniref:Uncharacterized protein n=1 Tax=Halosquirtibacter laminarini TaxID=3374600 RepID=A0AC61NK60_9BACT|nr:hypothetical protein K4L44_02715 [Prolixibacteraceae bacterium]